jgi:hypothetical protein
MHSSRNIQPEDNYVIRFIQHVGGRIDERALKSSEISKGATNFEYREIDASLKRLLNVGCVERKRCIKSKITYIQIFDPSVKYDDDEITSEVKFLNILILDYFINYIYVI